MQTIACSIRDRWLVDSQGCLCGFEVLPGWQVANWTFSLCPSTSMLASTNQDVIQVLFSPVTAIPLCSANGVLFPPPRQPEKRVSILTTAQELDGHTHASCEPLRCTKLRPCSATPWRCTKPTAAADQQTSATRGSFHHTASLREQKQAVQASSSPLTRSCANTYTPDCCPTPTTLQRSS